jgi:hypothetical protein
MLSDVADIAVCQRKIFHKQRLWLMKYAVSGLVPIRHRYPRLKASPTPKQGRLSLEIVSHCWGYSHLQEYQLSSLVLNPPRGIDIIMTVYFSREDQNTLRLIEFFSALSVPGVSWQFRALPKEWLFRRSIGRNHAALNTKSDWIWFTDCDVIFAEGALDEMALALQTARSPLVFPRYQGVTGLLEEDQIRTEEQSAPRARPLPSDMIFEEELVNKATGPLQITHGDVARELGYCRDIAVYQVPEPVWQKCQEDRAFRWMLETSGEPIDVRGISRIRHIAKGRYTGSKADSRIRTTLRQLQDWIRSKS